MSFAGRDPIFGHLDEPQPWMQRRLASISEFVSQRRPRILIVAAIALIVAAASAALLFKSRDTSSARPVAVQPTASPVAVAAPPPKIDAQVSQIWDRLEPASKSYKIQIGNDNSLQTANQAIELYGAQIIPRTQVCKYLNGERWACGQRAYVALLNIFGGGTVDCKPQQINQPHIVVCQLGGKDIAELMLREGWANLANGVTRHDLADAAVIAGTRRVGMYRLEPANR